MDSNWQKDLYAATAVGPHRVLDLWRRQQSPGPPPPGSPVAFAKTLVRMARFDAAFHVLEKAGDDLAVQQLRALTLSKAGRVDESIEILSRLWHDGVRDEETGGLLGGRYKQRALDTGNEIDLQAAYGIYLETYESTKGTYPGINAASLALELHEPEQSTTLAREIKESIGKLPIEARDHWTFATLAEAHLLLQELDVAEKWYGRAVRAEPSAVENIATMRRQARRNLEGLGLPPDSLDGILTVRAVVAFTGHMVDAPDRAVPRFPASMVGDVRLAIRERLKGLGAGYGFSSAARGSDLLFLEELLNRGGRAEVFLPFPADDFIETSVGPEWENRFREVLADPRVAKTILAERKPPDDGLDAAFLGCNAAVHRAARQLADRLEEKPRLLAVWNGDPGDGRGGTADAARAWRDLGLEVETIDISVPPVPTTPPDRPATRDLSLPDEGPPPPPPPPTEGEYRAKYCLCIGVQESPGWPILVNTENDAREVGRTLETDYGFEPTLLINEDATQRRIAETMQDTLPEKVQKDDLVVVFFAGHGHTVDMAGQDRGFVVPADADGAKLSKLLSMDQLADWSTFLDCRHILYVFDSCFSGLFARMAGGDRLSPDDVAEKARIVITAGRAREPVLDGLGNGHSVFTRWLLTGLRDGVQNGDDFTATELYSFVRRKVKSVTDQQKPTFGTLKNHEGGEITLRKTSGAAGT